MLGVSLYLNIPANCPGLDMVGKMNYKIHDYDAIVPIIYVQGNPSALWYLPSCERTGSTSPGTWIDFSFEYWISPYLPKYGPHLINFLDWIASTTGGTIDDVIGIGFALMGSSHIDFTTTGLTTGPWSGMLLDDVELELPYSATGGPCVFIAWGDPGNRMLGWIPFPYFYDFDYGTSGFLWSNCISPCIPPINPAFHIWSRFDRTEGTITVTAPAFGFNLAGSRLSVVILKGTPSDITGASYKLLYN